MYATEWKRITGNWPLSTVFQKTESSSQTRIRLEGGPGGSHECHSCWVWACVVPLAQSKTLELLQVLKLQGA